MNIAVNQDLCNGCSACVDSCPHGAIGLVEGIAFVDQSLCSDCQTCVELCPTGAIYAREELTPVRFEKPGKVDLELPLGHPSPLSNLSTWGGTALALVGQHVLPRLVDALIASVERKWSAPVTEHSVAAVEPAFGRPYRQRRQRRGRKR